MRTSALFALTASSLCLAEAVSLTDPSAAPRAVQFDIQRRPFVNPLQHDRIRRRQAGNLQVTLNNEQTLYFVNCTLGTPAQAFELSIDTGSSDLWVNSPDSSACTGGSTCSTSGTYNANSSSTYTYLNSAFNITYLDGSGAAGDYVTDTLSIGGAALASFQFGIGYQSTSAQGILGIGYGINEVQAHTAGLGTYPNLPSALLNAGYIQSKAYSLWLNDLEASTGSILFGGVNPANFQGNLTTLPIVPYNVANTNVYAEFIITLTGLGLGGAAGSISPSLAIPVLLDSGTSLIYLPDQYAQTIMNQFGARYDANQGVAFVNCDQANNATTVDFTFSSPTISIPMSELVQLAGYYNRQPVCILGVAPSGSGTVILGDSFLRSAYVVYDLANNEISIAQTKFNATGGTILEITNGTNGVPDATRASAVVAATLGATGQGRLSNPSVTITGVATATAGAAALRTAMPVGVAAVAAVAGALFAL